MKPTDYLKTALNRDNRKEKVEFLFKYFQATNVKHTYNRMIDYVSMTDEEINNDIKSYLK